MGKQFKGNGGEPSTPPSVHKLVFGVLLLLAARASAVVGPTGWTRSRSLRA